MKQAKGWPWVALGDVVEFPGAGVPVADCTTLHPVLTFKGLQRTGELRFDDPPTDQEVSKNSMVLLRAGDTVATNQGHTIGWILKKVGYIPPLDPFPVAASTLQVFRPRSDSLAPRYLFHYLAWTDTYRRVADIAGSRSSFTAKMFAAVPVLLPPLAEQKRIAGILDAADTLRTKRREALAQLDTLIQSTLLHMFGDPVTNPKGLEVELLGELIAMGPQNGLYKPERNYGSGVRILRIDGFYGGAVNDLSTLKRVGVSEQEIQKYGLLESDIVINRVNSRSHLGKSALIPDLGGEPVVFESNMMRLTVDSTRVSPFFMIHFLQTSFIRNQILRSAKDSINQASINQGDVRELRILIPSGDSQRHFVSIAESIEQQKASQRAHLAELDTLFASLQSRVFRGDL